MNSDNITLVIPLLPQKYSQEEKNNTENVKTDTKCKDFYNSLSQHKPL